MKNKLNGIIVISLCIMGIWATSSCKKEVESNATDIELYTMAKSTENFTWYKNSDALLNKSSGSAHTQPFLRTRYNSVAATQLDSNGKTIPGSTFPEGSLVVKELYDNATKLGRYAILYKDSESDVADSDGWVWGYINADGSVAETSGNKGNACKTCHSQEDNIDNILMNIYFP